MKRGWIILCLCLVRCQSCLPPLLPDATAIVPFEPPAVATPTGPTSVLQLPCADEQDCASGFCCAGVCGACCQTSDCTPGLVCQDGACAACGPTTPCGAGEVCCDELCTSGACCADSDCAGNPAGEQCINNVCALSMCSGVGSACAPNALCCGGACIAGAQCCADSECGGGVCASHMCAPCDENNTCEAGNVCCAGTCVMGDCCATCSDPFLACVNNSCTTCTSGDCDCCDDPTLGNICLPPGGCCPGANTCPPEQACGVTTRTCGACDASSPCAPGRTCCNGTCIANTACCSGSDCATGVCVAGTCAECAGDCGTPTATTGMQVCVGGDCVDCTPATCNGVCCGGSCFAGGCCASSDCGAGAPICQDHTCRGCANDGECGGGEVCVSGACQPGDCHSAADCAGACCNFNCAVGGNCCSTADCSAASPGYQPASVCGSARAAAPTFVCGVSHTCACAEPVGGVVYVDGTLGHDVNGNGSAACPWRTITRALGAGTTINVRPGTYSSAVLDIPANTVLQRDPTCASGTVVVHRTSGPPSDCPVQRGAAASCAIAVRAPGVTLRDLYVKNSTGRAIAFGTGADATTTLASGVIGCTQLPVSLCDRAQALGQNDHDDILVAGTASPVIGPDASNIGALQLAPSRSSAIAIADTATPLVRNLSGLTGMDGDVIRIQDGARPALSNVQINWPGGPVSANLTTCVNITGSGGGFTMSQVWMHGCTGGIFLRRSMGGSTIRHTWSDVRVEGSTSYGATLDSPSDVSLVTINGGRFATNNGHGINVIAANLALNGTSIDSNGAQPPAACYGGNGINLSATTSVAVINNAVITNTRGVTTASCFTGNGIRVVNGRLTLQTSQLTNNAFDGLLLENGTANAFVSGSRFTGNAANGIGINRLATVQLGTCGGDPLQCLGGANVFQCGGNGRMNLCLVTPDVPNDINAQNNEWQGAPPSVTMEEYDGTNNHCEGMLRADIGNVTTQFPFVFDASQINTAPERTPRVCN